TRPVFDTALDAVGLLGPPDDVGERDVIVPIALFRDPGAWLRRLSWQAGTVALLDALAALVVPDRGSTPGWPVADGVGIGYSLEAGSRLRLVVDLTLAVGDVTTSVAGGLLIGADGLPAPTVAISVDIGGKALTLTVGGEPPVQLTLGSLRLY